MVSINIMWSGTDNIFIVILNNDKYNYNYDAKLLKY